MRFETFIEKAGDLLIIPEYVFFQVSGHTQSTRNLIYRWCRQGRLIRIKRGLYVLGDRWRKQSSYLSYLIANSLVSPSYVSLDTALSYYDLIPERVVEVTSVCFKRPKKFTNALGSFSYRKLDEGAYPGGIVAAGDEGESFFIAGREKAVLDKIYFGHPERYFRVSYLFDSLRMERDDLATLNFDLLEEYAESYPTRKMKEAARRVRKYYGV